MRILIAAIAVLVASCAPSPTSSPSPDQIIPIASLTPAECAERRGTMQSVGRAQIQRCVFRYADAGKRCTDGDQCLGDCRLPEGTGEIAPGASVTGVCQADTNSFGCHTTVEDGKVGVGLCVD